MNDTVARIVEIMFQDTEMTEEVAAIRDEVMNNCQERYQDMLDHGMSEDDAVAAVIESLKGMEEVISQYPRKGHTASCKAKDEDDLFDGEEEDEGQSEYTFGGGDVKLIDLTLIDENVTVEASYDRDFHVEIDGDEPRGISVTLNHGTLRIIRNENYIEAEKQGTVFTAHGSGKMDLDGVDWNNIDSIEKFGRKLGSMFKNIRIKLHTSFCDGVTVYVPKGFCGCMSLMTTSGDMDVTDAACKTLRAVTTNGDVSVQMTEDGHCTNAEIISTSGDLDLTLYTDQANLRTTSGDIELEGRCHTLNISTVSGDMNVRADVEACTFKAISGDVDLEFDSDELRSVNGTTISGDVEVSLPSGIGSNAIQTHTISGDVTTRCHTNGYGPCVAGSISTTSGDITIC